MNRNNVNFKRSEKTGKKNVGKEEGGSKKKKNFRPTHRRQESIRDGDVICGCEAYVPLTPQEHHAAWEILIRDICLSQISSEDKTVVCRIIAEFYGLSQDDITQFMGQYIEHSGRTTNVIMQELLQNVMDLVAKISSEVGVSAASLRRTLIAVWCIWKHRKNKPVMMDFIFSYIAGEASEFVCDLLLEFLKGGELPSSPPESFGEQSAEFGTSCAILRDLRSSPAFDYGRTLCNLICTIGLVPKQEWTVGGFQLFMVEPFSTTTFQFTDIMDRVLESMAFFFERGYACFDKRSLKPFLYTTDEMMCIETDHHILVMDVRAHVQGKTLSDGDVLYSRIREMRERMNVYNNTAKAVDRVILRRLSKAMLESEADLQAYTKSRTLRLAPFCVKTYGTSGVGKTSFNQITMREVLRFNGYAYADFNLSRIEPEKAFWEHVHNESTGLVIDDMCNTVSTKEKCNPAELLITLVNNQPYSVNRADIADKGQIWINAKVVGITTNNRKLDADKWSIEPMSVVRRCHLHIDLKVKAKYANKDGQLDSAKAAESPSTFGYVQDLWDITVSRVTKVTNTTARTAEQFEFEVVRHKGVLLKDVPMLTYLDFLYDASAKHFEEQKKFVDAKTIVMKKDHLCPKTGRIVTLLTGMENPEMDDDVIDEYVIETVENEEQNGYFTLLLLEPLGLAYNMEKVNYFLTLLGYLSQFVGFDVAYYYGFVMAGASLLFRRHWLEKFIMRRAYTGFVNRQFSSFERGVMGVAQVLSNSYLLFVTDELFDSWRVWAAQIYAHYRLHKFDVFGTCSSPYRKYQLYIFLLFVGIFKGWLVAVLIGIIFHILRACECAVNTIFVIHEKRAELRRTRKDLNLHNFTLFDIRKASNDPRTLEGLCGLLVRGGIFLSMLAVVRQIFSLASVESEAEESVPLVDNYETVPNGNNVVVPPTRAPFFQIKTFDGEHGNTLSSADTEVVLRREREKNMWAHTTMNLEPASTSTTMEVCNRISKNMLHMRARSDATEGAISMGTYCDAIMLRSNIVMMPLHMWYRRDSAQWIKRDEIEFEFIRAPTPNSGWKERLCYRKGHRIPDHDLIIFPVFGGGIFKDIIKDFAPTRRIGLAKTIYRTREGNIDINSANIVDSSVMRYERPGISFVWEAVDVVRDRGWNEGDCMTVVVDDSATPKISGFHLLGCSFTARGTSVYVSQKMIQDFILSLESELSLHCASEIPAVVHGVDLNLSSQVHFKSPVHFIENRNVTVLGSCIGRATYVSEVRPSICSEIITPYIGPMEHGPPPFKGNGNEPWKPWFVNMDKLSSVPTNVDDNDLDWARFDYCEPMLRLAIRHSGEMGPLNREQIINGRMNSRFLTPMNYASSIGFPLTGPKRNYMRQVGERENTQPIFDFIDDSFYEEWDRMEKKYLSLECAHPIFKASLKDEPVKLGKDKVRVFQAVGMGMQIGLRKYYMPIVRLMGLYPLISECAVGINAHGREWDEVHKHFTYYGDDRCLAGDYKGWDTSIPAKLILCAFDCMIAIARSSGKYTELDIRIMKGLAMDVAYATTSFNGTLVRFHGTNPSGQNLTAHINSICNSLLLRCAYHYYSVERPLAFRDTNKIITYGDDFVGSAREDSSLDMVKYAHYCANKIGIVVTTPQKTAITEPYVYIEDVDFLKRSSRWRPELGVFIGVLALESIHRSLHCTMCSRGDERNTLVSTMRSALAELFFHGQETYERYCDIFEKVLKELDITHYRLLIPYEDRVMNWHEHHSTNEASGSPLATIPEEVMDDGYTSSTLTSSEQMGVAALVAVTSSPPHLAQWRTTQKEGLTNNIREEINSVHDEIHGGKTTPLSWSEQSGIVTNSEGGESSVVKFDVNETWSREILVARDETFDIIHTSSEELPDVLKRPKIIYNTMWNQGDVLSDQIDLLKAFISSSQVIREKVNHYSYISGTMCIKATVNGSPFMYGKTIISARHWPEVDGPGGLGLTQLTSLPYISITPTDGTAGCMEIPLLAPDGGVSLTEYSLPVQLVVRTMNPLRVVKESLANAEISVWAWFKEYTLYMPTAFETDVGFTEQSGDEYSLPITSTTATTIAGFLGKLSNWPVVGRYARASEIAVGAGAQIAQLFGYSKPSTIHEAMHMQNVPLGDLSSFNGKDSCVKLALDCKNEVTVDPQVTGYGGPDDMIIRDMCKREAHLDSFGWDAAAKRGKVLWKSVVNPGLCKQLAVGLYGEVAPVAVLEPTPLAHTSFAFEKWRGTIQFRFEVIGSQFHQGKLRVSYEPSAAMGLNWALEENLLNSRVIDLSQEREFVMSVGWGQLQNYCEVTTPYADSNPMFTTEEVSALAFNPFAWNGCIGITVVNGLTCVDDEPVEINVYIRAGDDFELQVPSVNFIGSLNTGLPNMIEQSGVIPLGDVPDSGVVTDEKLNDSNTVPVLVDKLAHIHFGERIVSIRQLMKRYCVHTIYIPPGGTVPKDATFRWRVNDFPSYSGPDSKGTAVTVFGRWNINSPANYLNYFTPCFLMRRGAIRNKYVIINNRTDSGATTYELLANRTNASGFEISLVPYVDTFEDSDMIRDRVAKLHLHGAAGASVTVTGLKPTLEIETPNYNVHRWYFAQDRAINHSFDSIQDSYTRRMRKQTTHSVNMSLFTPESSGITRSIMLRRYTSAGDDYSLHYYCYPPILYVMDPINYPASNA